MKFKDLLRIIRNNALLVVLAALCGGLVTAGVSLLVPPTYSAKSDLFVSMRTANDPTQMQSASTFIQERMQTYVRMADDRAVLEPVIKELGLNVSPEELSDTVKASSETGTVLISIEADAGTADSAAELSNAVAKSLVTAIESLEGADNGQDGSLKLVVANPAVPPLSPDGFGWWMSGILGILLGLSLGVGISILLSVMDTKLRSKEDVENLTQTPILAAIPSNADLREHPLDLRNEPFTIASESFRRLRTNLQFARIEDKNRAIVVTSAQAGEGKTMTSINLAIAMAQKGQRVALVDVDLRSPSVAERLGLENSMGLTSALVGEADVADLLQPWGLDELYVLTAGNRPPNPTEILDSRAMSRVLTRLLDEFDSVILDAPPTLPVADSLVIGKLVGRIVVVVGLGDLRDRDLTETLTSLCVVDKPISLVLNKVPLQSTQTAGYYAPYVDSAETPLAHDADWTIHTRQTIQPQPDQTSPDHTKPTSPSAPGGAALGVGLSDTASHPKPCTYGAVGAEHFIPGIVADGTSAFDWETTKAGSRNSQTQAKSRRYSRKEILARERDRS